MRLLKYFSVLFVALLFCAVGVSSAHAADWAGLYESSDGYVIGLDHYSSDIGAVVVDDPAMAFSNVLLTQDGWESTTEHAPTTDVLWDIKIIDENTVIVIGENGAVYKTDDFGDSWSKASILGSYDFRRIEMYDSDNGWIVGESGVIYVTGDGGDSWTPQGSGVTEDLNGAYFLSSNYGYAVGDNGTFIMTIDGGSTWVDESPGGTDDFSDVYFINTARGFIASDDGLLYTTNSGVNWSDVSGLESANLSTFDFYSIYFGAAVGLSAVYTTDDQGATWTSVDLPDESLMYFIYDVEISPSDPLKIVGFNSEGVGFLYLQDEEGPSAVSNLSSNSPTATSSIQLTWDAATDDTGIDHYEVDQDGDGYVDVGSSESYVLSVTEGSHEVSVKAVDLVGNSSEASSVTVVSDQTGPTVSTVSPISATEGVATTLTVTATDALTSIDLCYLYLNGTLHSAMSDLGDGTFSSGYTFGSDGTYSAYVVCEDEVGNSTTGSTSSITVGVASESTEPTEPDETTYSDDPSGVITDIADLDTEVLIKSQCIDSTDVNDPCRAVYYYDSSGERHAFPNSKVYFTWFESFDDIVIIDSTVMADAPLGSNVTYRPGVKMVKFQTVNTVYAVEQGGVLRAIASEDIAEDLYGSDWNQQIDDISDAFFSNYSFGSDIDDAGDYDVDDVYDSVSSLEDNF